MKKEIIFFTLIPLALFLFLVFYKAGTLQSYSIAEPRVISLAQGFDVDNADTGTLTITMAMPLERVKKEGKVDKILIFESKYIDGLQLVYDVTGQFLEGGVPQLQSTKVMLFDGNKHTLAYSYDRARDGQAIFVDGEPIAMGRYLGKKTTETPTGAAVGILQPYLLEGATATFEARRFK